MAFYKFLNSTISARVSGSDHLKVKLIIAKSCSFLLITAMPCRITKSLEFWEFSSLLKLFFVCFDHNYGTFFKSMRFNILKRPWGRFIYIIDSSNSSSFTFWSTVAHCKTSPHCWQTSNYKHLANLGAIECLQRIWLNSLQDFFAHIW